MSLFKRKRDEPVEVPRSITILRRCDCSSAKADVRVLLNDAASLAEKGDAASRLRAWVA